ncbi:MAG: hypothetical protein KatS3mg117_1984 [Geminicoccaceae bacterium]|jgi:Uma2 family endonuclease|nr:MAG: hypothetical protein KatS3mg117_1984 [Geminicoccaceae bacterium]
MAEAARTLVTVAEFLAFEGEPDRRYELIGGEIVALAPPARLHRRLTARLGYLLARGLRSPCAPEVEAGIVLPWSANDFFVADLAVNRTPPAADQLWCPDPLLVAEILSASTEGRDRNLKLPAYRRIPSIQHILLLRADRPSVEHYARTGPFWRLWDLGPGDVIRLEDLGVELALDELYEGLPVETAAEPG